MITKLSIITKYCTIIKIATKKKKYQYSQNIAITKIATKKKGKLSIITEYCTITKTTTKKKGKKTIKNNRILYDNKNNYEKKGGKNYQK